MNFDADAKVHVPEAPSPDSIAFLRSALIEKCGEKSVLSAPEALWAYGKDESHCAPALPHLAFFPSGESEVSFALSLCSALKIPVTPSGARTGKSGGAIPAFGGLALCMERMNRIIEISVGDMVAVVEPGVITGDLMKAAERQGLFYPPDPASLAECSIGGNIAENAGGPRAFKYGVTRDYVLALRAVLMDGTVISAGHRYIKGVAGYDLVSLLTGSEGTLGVVTQATLKLIPLPKCTVTALLTFESVRDASQAVEAILASRTLPRALELMDKTALAASRADGFDLPEGAGSALVVELDGESAEELENRAARLAGELRDFGLITARAAKSEEEREELWAARRSVSRSLKKLAPNKASEDIAVPRSKIPDMVEAIGEIGKRFGIVMAAYGHAGDGNLHVNFLYGGPKAQSCVEGAISDLMDKALSLGGTITGEHGTGLAKKEFLRRELSSESLSLHRRLKAAFDPGGLLNPGKIF